MEIIRKSFKSKLKIILNYIIISGLLLVPLVLIILPADFFDTGQSVCLSVLLFEQTCYGCGMTRAIQHLLHLEYDIACSFNKLSVIVLPLLVFVWFGELKSRFNQIRNHTSA
jgi:hypothetical protein